MKSTDLRIDAARTRLEYALVLFDPELRTWQSNCAEASLLNDGIESPAA